MKQVVHQIRGDAPEGTPELQARCGWIVPHQFGSRSRRGAVHVGRWTSNEVTCAACQLIERLDPEDE